ncbi:hypothetical protein GCM10009000_042810 [Halobacterium noricense]
MPSEKRFDGVRLAVFQTCLGHRQPFVIFDQQLLHADEFFELYQCFCACSPANVQEITVVVTPQFDGCLGSAGRLGARAVSVDSKYDLVHRFPIPARDI